MTPQLVATFDHQVTGVTVSPQGRIFVNFPRWTEDSPVSVAEVLPGGAIRAFPDDAWNSWRNARKNELSAGDRFVCVQSVVADGRNNLWVLDPAAPAQERIVPGGPKLVRIDLATNAVARTIAFDETIAPQGSYLNDVRFSLDGAHAYITDSGARGALVVVDLASGTARRVLDGHPSTQPEKDVVVTADGRPLRRPDGRGVEFGADGIALAADGRTLYWQALTGRTLYGIPTAALDDPALTPAALAAQVARIGINGVADGLLIDRQGQMYVTSPEDSAVKLRDGDPSGVRTGDQLAIVAQGARLRWPDTLAAGPDGAIYVTTSRIPDMQWFKPDNSISLQTQLWAIVPTAAMPGLPNTGGGGADRPAFRTSRGWPAAQRMGERR